MFRGCSIFRINALVHKYNHESLGLVSIIMILYFTKYGITYSNYEIHDRHSVNHLISHLFIKR